jgi:hypothetical protein
MKELNKIISEAFKRINFKKKTYLIEIITFLHEKNKMHNSFIFCDKKGNYIKMIFNNRKYLIIQKKGVKNKKVKFIQECLNKLCFN